MEIVNVLMKRRSEFNRLRGFVDSDFKKLVDMSPEPSTSEHALHKDQSIQAGQELTENEVNTVGLEFVSCGMNHIEGGWSKDIDHENMEQTIRFRKKAGKNEAYISSILQLGRVMEFSIRQNNAIDKYEQYFEEEEEEEENHDVPYAKTVTVLRYSRQPALTQTNDLSSPGEANCIRSPPFDPTYICSLVLYISEKPSIPEMVLKPSSPLVCLEYNPRVSYTLMGGCYNGQVAYWDTRRGCQTVAYSSVEHSHKDPVYKVIWLQSKTGTDAFSASTDGQVLWWDVRKLSEPTERLILDLGKEGNLGRALGAISLEFEITMPTKFMVGTEEGLIISCNRKAKTPAEKIVCTYDGHHGSVYAVQRNPFLPKNFLTVGDWCARIWSEDIKESSIINTKHGVSELMDACWSPVRPSVFFTVKMNGVLDVWDILFSQSDPTLSVKVCDSGLYSIRVQENGHLVACGSEKGEATLLEISSGLSTAQKNEKSLVAAMFERETKREKILMGRQREIRLKERCRSEQSREEEVVREDGEESPQELLARAEKDFYSMVEAELKRRRKGKDLRQVGQRICRKCSSLNDVNY
uniref:Dynein, axonemal, intermediate chain 2b n=1 Tax=Oryzias melastigma TaxID=30732 RepID=A0A3B3BWR0_ORYME